MANPFERRATEYARDSASFLSIVTPEPLRTFLSDAAKDGVLYDRLVLITGSPGSGKTTIATLLQFHHVDALRRNQDQAGYKEFVSALRSCGAIDEDARPRVAGVRLPLESEYRDFWELPYPVATRTRLVLALIASRAMLGWFRNLTENTGRSISDVRLIPRAGAHGALAEIGGTDGAAVLARAAAVERAVYQIGAALVPPATEADFPEAARGVYRPFDAIEGFELPDDAGPMHLVPLVMLDDAHTLHPEQLGAINRELARRELRIARWVLTRLDVLTPTAALLSTRSSSAPAHEPAGPQFGREVHVIAMQSGQARAQQRRDFRKMAADMADRYLRQMPEFARRGHDSFAALLETASQGVAPGTMKKLAAEVDVTARRLGLTAKRCDALREEVRRYAAGSTSGDVGADIQAAMLMVLMHRYAKRVPQGSLFEITDDVEPRKPVKADAGVAEAARIHLRHRYQRPYFYGIETICDAASENAEQFLHLAAGLVHLAETRLIRNRQPTLDARVQDSILRDVALKILDKYDYPYAREALGLADALAQACLERSLEPNASLGAGANAVGILQEEFVRIPEMHKQLAAVLQFGVAYNVLTLAQDYGQGGKQWCLLELGGCVIIKHGLTLKRGGFLEMNTGGLVRLLSQVAT